jgi:hypothetical protein
MALKENMGDGQALVLHTAHERCTTIVPVACMLRLPAAQTEDPASRAIRQAALEDFDVSHIADVVECLARVDSSSSKLQRYVLVPISTASTNVDTSHQMAFAGKMSSLRIHLTRLCVRY